MVRRAPALLLTLVGLLLIVSTLGQAEQLLTRHVRDVVRDGRAPLVGHLPANKSLRLVVTLPLRDETALDQLLENLQNPDSPSYHQYLTVEEFADRYGSTRADYEAVQRWAEAQGLTVVALSRNRVNIDVKGTVSNIENALHVSLGIYQHPTENRTFYAVDREPSPDLSLPLWHIEGLDSYSIPHPALKKLPKNVRPPAVIGSCPDESFCGSDMRAAYYGSTTLTGAGQSVGLLEYAGTDLADLNTYYTNAHQTLNVPITLTSVDGTPTDCFADQGCDDTEQTLDMTQALGMAPNLTSLTEFIGSTDTALLNGMATSKPLNFNLSSSWYWNPADPNTDTPFFKEFALQGQSFFDAAGDHSDWQRSGSIWPSDSQYAISVGGTDLETSGPGGPWKSESAWSDGGGGYSPNNIPIPVWQVTTAKGCSDCSQTLRNGPDVSANSNFTFYVCADQTTCSANEYGGTSFAAPMWAGYIALANEFETGKGRKTLGFINPRLYQLGLGKAYESEMHDITTGSNGYPATVGYDLATGWGSPRIGFLP